MPEIDYATASQSKPFFLQSPEAQGAGLSITTQRSNLNLGVNGVANDLGDQNTDVTTALDAIITAINAKPSA